MLELTSLSRDVTPHAFFQLVETSLASQPAPPGASDDKAVMELTGQGGGSWTMGFEGGQLKIREGTVANPPLAVNMSVLHWRELVAGRVRDAVKSEVNVSAFDPGSLGKLYQSADKVERLKTLKGSLKFVIEDAEAKDAYVVLVATGGAPRDQAVATATVSVSLPDFVPIAAGRENPQQAFFMGKIRIDGDMNHVMGLMAISMM
jgi:putative sterol carrier protein